jgi:tyrosinase
MAGVRRNILTDATARNQYIEGARLLKAEQLGPTTTTFGIPGPALPVSTWDLFVAWHHIAMNRFTPPSQMDRHAASRRRASRSQPAAAKMLGVAVDDLLLLVGWR